MPSFRPKTNNQSIKMFLSLFKLSKSRQKLEVILENKVHSLKIDAAKNVNNKKCAIFWQLLLKWQQHLKTF